MKYLILGVNGMAGHMIAMYLKNNGHDVTGFAKNKSLICDTVIGDALDKNSIKEVVNKMEYDFIINCIGILNKAVDRNLADGIYLNSFLPQFVAKCIEGKKSKLIHISSDCVFSGKCGHYSETSLPDETSMYGRTKLLGEINDECNLTIRTSIIGPELKKNGVGLFHWFMLQNGEVNGFTKAIWTGVTTLELAKAIEKMSNQNITGLYHLVNDSVISKYELLCLFKKYFRNNEIKINKETSFETDKSIINTREDFNYSVPSYEQMILEMAGWMNKNKELYQQYIG